MGRAQQRWQSHLRCGAHSSSCDRTDINVRTANTGRNMQTVGTCPGGFGTVLSMYFLPGLTDGTSCSRGESLEESRREESSLISSPRSSCSDSEVWTLTMCAHDALAPPPPCQRGPGRTHRPGTPVHVNVSHAAEKYNHCRTNTQYKKHGAEPCKYNTPLLTWTAAGPGCWRQVNLVAWRQAALGGEVRGPWTLVCDT